MLTITFAAMERILITGASGFIGSFLVEEALRRGFETWAAVRAKSSRKYLSDERIRFVELNFSDEQQMTSALSHVQFDYVIHAAGVTKTTRKESFYEVNTDGTRNFALALLHTQTSLKRFVFLSSLSVMGQIRQTMPYEEMLPTDEPQPSNHYGRSKLKAEQLLFEISEQAERDGRELPFVILRPTGVYGPREKDYMMMVDSIRQHIDFAVGFKPQAITFVYVSDVVDAAFLALNNGKQGGKYFLTDGEVYDSATFSRFIRQTLGNPFCLRLTAPIWLLRIITTIGEYVGRATGHISALNNDKYYILKQRNWKCDITSATNELGFVPKVKLEEGVRKMIEES